MRVPRAASAAGIAALLLSPAIALAHPVDEVIQGAYLTLAPGQVLLELDITPGTEVLSAVARRLDPDGDHRVTPAEARAFGLAVLAQSSLTLDGRPAAWTFDRVDAPAWAELSEAGVIKLYAGTRRDDRPGPHVLAFENRYAPAKGRVTANVFLRPGRGWRYAVTGQDRGADGKRLAVRFTVAR